MAHSACNINLKGKIYCSTLEWKYSTKRLQLKVSKIGFLVNTNISINNDFHLSSWTKRVCCAAPQVWPPETLPAFQTCPGLNFTITVQNSGKWLTWNICTGGMGYAGYATNAGMYWVLSIDNTQYPKYHYQADMPGGLGGPTQYSILDPGTLTPRTLGIIITVGLGQRCWQICQGA